MRCPKCNSDQLFVADSRRTDELVTRRRKCGVCGIRFTTVEITQEAYDKLIQNHIVKSKPSPK